jgi:hypothetical protein
MFFLGMNHKSSAGHVDRYAMELTAKKVPGGDSLHSHADKIVAVVLKFDNSLAHLQRQKVVTWSIWLK